ncbi:fumarylacetoacetate hydrolase family protein [Acidisoma cellulosilytica]|uniref:Fumarylacetoacetate hydrolase family protein n=1 Tax=Acidisoma cellulosilyticum TaxID=2802395 RepID=A0A963Z2G5_9PROT|nr:fumarylacetoacetate hydrolase family protein [Acidisoma cellulosilyticum]MCB8881509.1 fumarylacetoacetate hydrolase family protein [Acidisoma cellulosilyticum]
MRLISFLQQGKPAIGVATATGIVDLTAADSIFPDDLGAFVRGGEALRIAAMRVVESNAPRVDEASIRYLPLIASPGKMICLGLNYQEHAAEGGYQRPEWPTTFLRCGTSLTAHGAAIIRPIVSEQLDYEAELAVIMGRSIRHATVEEGLDAVYGYSCFNDASVRDYQRKTIQWTMGKNFQQTGAFGPALVTADELPRGAVGLSIACRLNGNVVQQADTAQMIFPVGETLAMLSECVTLEAGDVIVMGTPSGVGHARKPPLWMRHGDTVEVEIEGVGLLHNVIEDEPASRPESSRAAA